jgi:hypothetical protein
LFVFVPLWLLLVIALLLAAARGEFDWLPIRRSLQHALVVATGITLFLTTLFGFLGRVEPASQLPLVSRPFSGWADLVFPPIVITFLLFSLNASLGALVPPLAYRVPFAAIAAIALAHGVALLGSWFWSAE